MSSANRRAAPAVLMAPFLASIRSGWLVTRPALTDEQHAFRATSAAVLNQAGHVTCQRVSHRLLELRDAAGVRLGDETSTPDVVHRRRGARQRGGERARRGVLLLNRLDFRAGHRDIQPQIRRQIDLGRQIGGQGDPVERAAAHQAVGHEAVRIDGGEMVGRIGKGPHERHHLRGDRYVCGGTGAPLRHAEGRPPRAGQAPHRSVEELVRQRRRLDLAVQAFRRRDTNAHARGREDRQQALGRKLGEVSRLDSFNTSRDNRASENARSAASTSPTCSQAACMNSSWFCRTTSAPQPDASR